MLCRSKGAHLHPVLARVLIFSLGCGVGMVGSLRDGTPGAGRVMVCGDDFREAMTLELGS